MQFTGGKMAVEQINKAGGIKGKQIEAVIDGTQRACDPKQAVAVANKVINDGASVSVVGQPLLPTTPCPLPTSMKMKAC